MKSTTLIGITIILSMSAGYWLSEMNRFSNGVVADAKRLELINPESPIQFEGNEDFQNFVWKFSTDSLFQFERIQFPLTTELVNEDFETELTKINRNRWQMTYLFANQEYRVQIYDNWEAKLDNNNKRLIVFHGIENGIRIEYHFQLIDRRWFLIKFADYST